MPTTRPKLAHVDTRLPMPWLLGKVFWLRDDSQVYTMLRLRYGPAGCGVLPVAGGVQRKLYVRLCRCEMTEGWSGMTSRCFGLQRIPRSADRGATCQAHGRSDLRVIVSGRHIWVEARDRGPAPCWRSPWCVDPPKLNSQGTRKVTDRCTAVCTK